MPVPLTVHIIHSDRVKTRHPAVAKLKKMFAAMTATRSSLSETSPDTLDVKQVDVVHKEHEPDQIPRTDIAKLAEISAQGLDEPFDRLAGSMHLHQLSNALKHFAALSRIAETPAEGPRAHLVVEDDVLYNEEILEKSLARALSGAPSDWGIMFLGLPSAINTAREENEQVHYQPIDAVFKVVPSCESYIVTPEAAKKLVAAFLPVRFPTNVHLSWLLLRGNDRLPKTAAPAAYVVTPSVFLDGSKYGTCSSVLNVNNRLSWNPWYLKMFALIRANQGGLPTDAAQTIDKLYESMNFKNHPDAVFLYGLSFMKRGDYLRARDLFTTAYQAYDKNGCIMNRASEFLNLYADLHKFLQADVPPLS